MDYDSKIFASEVVNMAVNGFLKIDYKVDHYILIKDNEIYSGKKIDFNCTGNDINVDSDILLVFIKLMKISPNMSNCRMIELVIDVLDDIMSNENIEVNNK